MKKIALLLALLMCLTLVFTACGKTNDGKGTDSAPKTANTPNDEDDDDEIFFDPSLFQVKAVDEKTLEVTLGARTPYFLELTAFPTFSPVRTDIIGDSGDKWATSADTYVGNGPYQVSEWVTSSHITMEKNENYWDAANVGPDKIVFNLIEDDNAQLNSYQTGDLAFIDSVPQDMVQALREDPEFHVTSQLGTYYVSYNTEMEPFDNPLVRQAFTLAVDRDFLANVVGEGMYTVAGAYVSTGLTDADPTKEFRDIGGDYYNPNAEANEENLERAKELLAEAGYPNGEGIPTINYIYNDTTLHKSVAEALQNMWGKLGVTVTIEVQEWGTFLNTRKNGEYMAARNGWLADYNDPISFLDMWITGGGNNDAQWSNTEYDALITGIKASGNSDERMKMMHDAEDLLFDEWVLCPIMYYADLYMNKADLDDSIWASPLGYKYLMFAEGYETLDVCVGPNPDTIDPALNSSVDGATMIIHAFEGLYRLDKNGTPEPGMAEDVDISEDGLVYTFTLRDGIAWSDGTPITAQDFVDSWVRAINPETAADYSYMFECIAGYADALGGDVEH